MNESCDEAYKWLAKTMAIYIPKPKGVIYPIWAWKLYEGKDKPDRRKRIFRNRVNEYGHEALIYLEVPDDEVLLTNFDMWELALCGVYLSDKEGNEEDKESEWYDNLSDRKQKVYNHATWKSMIAYDNTNTSNWDTIQATFWVLKKEYVKKVVDI